jgi:urocanate hydratase
VVDFLVNSLDEALRILKNEIRKRETVAVCVAAAPEAIVEEMRERGVVADLSRPIEYTTVEAGQSLLVWSVADSSAAWLRELDAVALDCMDSESAPARRWLRLAPRYLGRMAQGVRVLRCNQEAAARLQEEIRARVADGRIPVPVELRHSYPAASIRFQSSFTP